MLFKSFRKSHTKSKKLKQISKRLGRRVDFSNLESSILVTKEKQLALEELIDLCESDEDLIKITKHYSADREKLKGMYRALTENGASEWSAGHWVPASTLVYGGPLEYLLRSNLHNIRQVSQRLIEYFRNGETGLVN